MLQTNCRSFRDTTMYYQLLNVYLLIALQAVCADHQFCHSCTWMPQDGVAAYQACAVKPSRDDKAECHGFCYTKTITKTPSMDTKYVERGCRSDQPDEECTDMANNEKHCVKTCNSSQSWCNDADASTHHYCYSCGYTDTDTATGKDCFNPSSTVATIACSKGKICTTFVQWDRATDEIRSMNRGCNENTGITAVRECVPDPNFNTSRSYCSGQLCNTLDAKNKDLYKETPPPSSGHPRLACQATVLVLLALFI